MKVLDCLWAAPPADIALSHDDVHVWCAGLDQPPSYARELARTLAGDERARAERFHFDRDRTRFIVGRGVLRTILGRYLGIEPARLRFCYGPHGKPALAVSPGTPRLDFSVSHSQALAVYAVTWERRIGIDLEFIRPIADAEQIAERFFSPHEHAVFRRLAPKERQVGFFNCWTRKEAYIKATGDGLAQPLDRFDVSLAPGDQARLLSIDGDPRRASRWYLQELVPAAGYLAALAVEGLGWNLACWRWQE